MIIYIIDSTDLMGITADITTNSIHSMHICTIIGIIIKYFDAQNKTPYQWLKWEKII